MVGRMMIAGGGNSVKDVSFAAIVFLISIFWPIAFCLCGTPHRHASLQQSLRRDQICSILTAKFKSKKSHYFCLLVVVLVAVVGEVALSQDVLRKSYFTDDSDENNDKKAEVVAFFTFEFCG